MASGAWRSLVIRRVSRSTATQDHLFAVLYENTTFETNALRRGVELRPRAAFAISGRGGKCNQNLCTTTLHRRPQARGRKKGRRLHHHLKKSSSPPSCLLSTHRHSPPPHRCTQPPNLAPNPPYPPSPHPSPPLPTANSLCLSAGRSGKRLNACIPDAGSSATQRCRKDY